MPLFHLVNILAFVRIQKYVFVFWFLVEAKFWDKHTKNLGKLEYQSSSKLECGVWML